MPGCLEMANHAVSGRLAGEPFTPGLTPHPGASPNLPDNLRDVAGLNPVTLDNNIAFNVKIVPGASDSHERIIGIMPIHISKWAACRLSLTLFLPIC